MRGVLVFPSRQIFSVPRFCQQITGAITTSRLEGLTSGLRITQTAIPLKRSSLAVSTLNWHRRLDLNQRMRESKSLALPLGYACMVFPCRNPTGDTGRVCSRVTGTAPAYGVELTLLAGMIPAAGRGGVTLRHYVLYHPCQGHFPKFLGNSRSVVVALQKRGVPEGETHGLTFPSYEIRGFSFPRP